jgi:hypothetical protein
LVLFSNLARRYEKDLGVKIINNSFGGYCDFFALELLPLFCYTTKCSVKNITGAAMSSITPLFANPTLAQILSHFFMNPHEVFYQAVIVRETGKALIEELPRRTREILHR